MYIYIYIYTHGCRHTHKHSFLCICMFLFIVMFMVVHFLSFHGQKFSESVVPKAQAILREFLRNLDGRAAGCSEPCFRGRPRV